MKYTAKKLLITSSIVTTIISANTTYAALPEGIVTGLLGKFFPYLFSPTTSKIPAPVVPVPAAVAAPAVPVTAPVATAATKITEEALEIPDITHAIVNMIIGTRLNLLPTAIAGVSAGDESPTAGNIWISGNYGTSKYTGHNKYSGKTYAATIGADKVLDNSVIGIAYNYVISDFKYKNSPDKISARNHLISIYGSRDLSDKILLQAIATVGFGNAHAKSVIQNQTVKSKVKSKISYSTEVALAYKGKIGKLSLTPKVAIKHGSYGAGSYTQNLEAQSISAAANRSQKTSMVIGLSAHAPIQVNGATIVTTGLHAEVEKALHTKQSKIKISAYNSNGRRRYAISSEKPADYGYKVGGSLSIKNGRMEIVTSYDYLRTNKKYSSHQGSIKLKVAL